MIYNYLLNFYSCFKQRIYFINKLLPYIWISSSNIRNRYIIFVLSTVVMMVLNIIFPLVLRKIILLLSLNLGNFSSQVIFFIFLYCFIWISAQACNLLREFLLLKAIEKSVNFLCQEVIAHIHKLPYHFHVSKKIGETISYIEKAYQAFPNILWGFLLSIIPIIIEIIIATGIIYYLYGYLLGAILIGTLFIFIIFSIVFAKFISEAQDLSNQDHFKANALIVDGLINFSLIKYFGNFNYENKQVKNLLSKRENSAVHAQKIACYMRLGQILIIGICIVVITLIAGQQTVYNHLSIADFILINSYILQFANPLFLFGYIFKEMRKGFTDMEYIFKLLKLSPQIEPNSRTSLKRHTKSCIVEFKNVSFAFNKEQNILKNVSFKLFPNKTVALVGGSGSGKSTISNLLFRFYTPNSGEILINGHNILDIHSDILTHLVGITPQNLNLFNNTIHYNLCYGNFNATSTEINNVLKAVQLTDMISNLPLGLETVIGENGLTLSSGEKQRITIARLLLKKPLIYIFDEVTSNLDFITEKHIQNSISKLAKNATFLIIAHRLAAITSIDHIIVLKQGVIVEEGKHQELLNNKGYYFELWKSQVTMVSKNHY
ncbi:ABC transporter ATP-binding protein/permease (plasmid) [Candidatus Bandiella numerosa]|uniref:ATP-binding cassette domain-containing protein n=1 Tax=Candidatus Bandiella numerosa TaxID=2570586 RepID=UPI00249DBBB4|nr:ABC transporter ATP-binding protein [Candidatus Bandiella numerosa]WHA05725.1 ABC transporter ATP-binding protein/permease [Candidatus Bandiella numerosa]